jgi:LPS sulfotransferase NodH
MKNTDDLLLDMMTALSKKESVDLNTITKKVLILSTPRSGSTIFCDVLMNTQKIGDCREWFNMRYLAAYGKLVANENVNINEYLQFIMAKTIGNTGIFAVNAHIEDVMFFAQRNTNMLDIGFDHIIYLSRDNKLAQAVSLAKSNLIDSWGSDIQGKPENLSKMNNAEIVNSLKHIIDSDTYYLQHLAKLTQAEYSYEDFSKLTTTTIFNDVLKQCGVEYNGSFSSLMQKQRDETSTKLMDDFRDYLLSNT